MILFPSEAIHQRILLYNNLVIARAITKLLYNGQWTLSAMTSKNKNSGNSWGTLYGRPMERLVFRYDRHEEIAIYIRMWNLYSDVACILSSNGNACVLLTFKNFRLLLLFQMS